MMPIFMKKVPYGEIMFSDPLTGDYELKLAASSEDCWRKLWVWPMIPHINLRIGVDPIKGDCCGRAEIIAPHARGARGGERKHGTILGDAVSGAVIDASVAMRATLRINR
jgi:hypothetical protein